ncbi:MAG: YqeG family HAD IIIA-type phosphatase [Candidatus Heteroscillospira sp.]|jgi:HAD superfamily phosphatase (TIGR01668 family)
MKLPIPTLIKHDIYELRPEELKALGVRFLMMDLDNTLSPYHIHEADDKLKAWTEKFRASGLELFILSNNHGQRPARFAEQLCIDYVNRAHKPGTETALRVMAEKGFTPGETAILGDQIYTDILCGARAGFTSVCVRPICISRNPLLAIRYFFEMPFRLAYKKGERV